MNSTFYYIDGTKLQPRQPCDLPHCPYCIECGLSDATTFAERLSVWLDEERVLREGLWHEGPELVEQLITKIGSLRGVGRAAGLSPTYLSQVRHSNCVLSPETFLQLHRLLEKPCRATPTTTGK